MESILSTSALFCSISPFSSIQFMFVHIWFPSISIHTITFPSSPFYFILFALCCFHLLQFTLFSHVPSIPFHSHPFYLVLFRFVLLYYVHSIHFYSFMLHFILSWYLPLSCITIAYLHCITLFILHYIVLLQVDLIWNIYYYIDITYCFSLIWFILDWFFILNW